MPKMSINDAAEYFGVSKEAIHNRVRRNSLQSVVENGVKLVIVDKVAPSSRGNSRGQVKKSVVSHSDRYYKLLEEQNATLQNRVEVLEGETRLLRDQKEQMLIEERIRIEQIYRDKDEQLKNILSSFSSKFMLNTPLEEAEEVEHLEAEIEIEKEDKHKILSLKKYLKNAKISNKKSQKIKTLFKKRAKKDDRIITLKNKYYMDTLKYDYSDLLK
ncbi:MAG: DNA-binding protein [Campylobacterota bacterium]|nr:DNA-binding protein [Campylobacterota bacterium]